MQLKAVKKLDFFHDVRDVFDSIAGLKWVCLQFYRPHYLKYLQQRASERETPPQL